MDPSSVDRDPVERLAEEFLERHRRGEHPPLTEYVDRHPEWAEEIRALFPALVMMERLKPAPGDVTGSFLGEDGAVLGQVPERLGEFRILREVGRGGMGIVYEALQESLGRHVALKVLPSHALLNGRHLQRFLREAKAAARLHHTNIVPVFGVGGRDGLHYYVMQFIAGSGLHQVIDDLRRLKVGDRPTSPPRANATRGPSLPGLAQGLMTGQFATTAPEGDDGPRVADASATSAADLHAGSAILSGSGRRFAREVARLGLQVAQALAYAHGRGVLHRDIKPSNLLLDVQGTVWVADFGLAKLSADGDDLTGEGDVLGTLRYMAPERFRGEADARSDLYALGLTLYELLTLRPAFDQEDRDRLIHQVTTEVPPRPRALNREIPRDLETIILKAIEHDPARRYQDAEELADDLGRFLADQPIRARAVGPLERLAKWARRKPVVAGLSAGLIAAVLLGFIGVTHQWRAAVAASRESALHAEEARRNFDHAMRTVDTFCTRVSQDQLLDQPGMLGLRRRLLDLALQYYLTFQGEQAGAASAPRKEDPRLKKDLALSFMYSGIIKNEFGDAAPANIALHRAKDLLGGLGRDQPGALDLRELLTRCCLEIEDVERLNDFEFRNNQQLRVNPSVSLAESLVAADRDNPEYLLLLGRSYDMDGLRWLRWWPQEHADAEVTFRKAVALLERVHQEAPDDMEGTRRLALAHAHLGLVHQQAGRRVERVASLVKALGILQTFDRRYQQGRRFRLDCVECLIDLGDAQIDLGRYQEAEASLTQAGRHLDGLDRADERTGEIRLGLATVQQGLGRLALARGRMDDAARALSRAIGCFEKASPGSLTGRELSALGSSYLWLGRVALEAGRPGEVPPLRSKLDEVTKAWGEGLLAGDPVPRVSAAVTRLREDAQALTDWSRASAPRERITARRREIESGRQRAARQPSNPDNRFGIAWGLVRIGELESQGGHLNEARASLEEALPALEALAGAEPENLRWRQSLARCWEALGRVQARTGHGAESRASAEKAVAIARELAQADSTYAYDLACMLCLRGTVSSSKSDEETAIATLRRAIEAGFDNGHLLRTDPRLDGLRSRPDFATLRSMKDNRPRQPG
jgi:serine/threonine-protein kinase